MTLLINKFKSAGVWYLLLLAVFTIPLSQFWSVRILVTCLLISFLSKSTFTFEDIIKQSFDVIIYFGVLVIGLIYSDFLTGIKVLETSISFLILLIIVSRIQNFTKDKMNTIFLAFTAGVLVASSICLIWAIYRYILTEDYSMFLFSEFTEIINSHPSYLAYYICFSMTLGMYFLCFEKLPVPTWLIYLVLLLLFIVLMLTGGRTAYISMLFTLSFFVLKFFFDGDSSIQKIGIFLLTLSFLIGMLIINHFNFNSPAFGAEGDYWERLSLWKSAIGANSDFVLGVGTGDDKTVMNSYYLSHGLERFARDSFNVHNQFLQSLLTNGIFGLLSIILLIARPIYLSIRYQNVFGVLVFFSFIIYGMTEVFLGRYQGVVFFALLHQVFIRFYNSSRSSFLLKEI